MIRRIAINTGGGDAPGLNAVIHAVALSALRRGWEVIGIRRGYEGLLESEQTGIIPLTREAVRGIAHVGGTILGTTNRGDPFNCPVLENGSWSPRTSRRASSSAWGSCASTRWWRSAATARCRSPRDCSIGACRA